ncbi:translocation/assembly module TamB domain-containing protein [Oleiharenicola lentus]|uniref:translocation/assembly module TamB domain-containing protein n=1 Tax=Oleiharenicola lentus TaxID=2508720 RepID=UPI003F6709C9
MPRWFKIILGLFAVLALAVATLPWWAGLAARPVLKQWDITFKNYERVGYSRFRIDELTFSRNNTTVVATGIEANAPLRWLNPGSRDATVKTWRVDVKRSTTPSTTPGKITGMPSLHPLLMKVARHLDRWLHHVEIGPGEVRWPNGGLTLEKAFWKNRTLNASGVNFLKQTGELTITTSQTENSITAETTFADEAARAHLAWIGAEITGEGTLWAQPLALRAKFPDVDWVPTEAGASAVNWNLPAERLKLGAQYARITGGAVFTWQQNAFTLSADAKAIPKDGVKASDLSANIEASGDRTELTLTALKIDAPFAQARLSAPVAIGFNGQTQSEPAKLSVTADLAKQPWFEASGTLKGNASVSRVDAPMEFQAELRDLTFADFSIKNATTRGRWLWPKLEISQLDAQLDAASKLSASGNIDWQARELAGVKLQATLGRAWFARWLKTETTWQTMAATATLDGSLDAPHHTGEVTIMQIKTKALKVFDATSTWRGTGKALENFSAQTQAGTTKVTFSGAGDENGFDVREFHLAPINAEALTLAQPARIDWGSGFKISGLVLKNSRSSFAADFTAGSQMAFALNAANFDKEWLGQWLDIPGPTWIVERLSASAKTVDDILNFSLTTAGEISAPQQRAKVSLQATGDAKGVTIKELKFADGERMLTQATGRLPFFWHSRETPHLRVDESAPLELNAEVLPDSPLWAAATEPVGLLLTSASAHAKLGGTLKRPQGELKIDVASVKVTKTGRFKDRLPDIEEFSLQASADRDTVKIDALSAKLEGQTLQATARLPMDDGRWRQLFKDPSKFDWDDAEGVVEIPDADLAPLARRLPDFVAAQGRLKARLELSRGGELTGSLQLSDAATRPIPALGTVQEINATLAFAGREAKIEAFNAKIGGEAVKLEGHVRFPLRAQPHYALHLSGRNLPLVRRAGLLLRSDLDLRATTAESGTTRVAGLVTLRDGLVLSDLSALLPSGTRGVTRRPPYFAIEKSPFNRWLLAVEVRGKNAVRVRTPVFTGTASAHFDLSGTLGEPRAVGEMTIDQGMLFFPFATFTVQSGAVRLRAADPFTPQLNVNAISRRHNYEIRLEVSGSPEAPALVFTSNPPMEASEVLLMVMAGQIPADENAGTTATGGVRLGQIGAYLGQGIYRGLGGSGENRLEIVSGEQISRQGRETYEVAYKLGEKWTLVGEYDEFDTYNAGLKWRVYTQEGAREKK